MLERNPAPIGTRQRERGDGMRRRVALNVKTAVSAGALPSVSDVV